MEKDEQLKLQKAMARASDRAQLIKSGDAIGPFIAGAVVWFLSTEFPNTIRQWSAEAWLIWLILTAGIVLGVRKMADRDLEKTD